MKIRFLGAAKTVTGSFFLVETDETRFAVDCGLFQGPRSLQERNYQEFAVKPDSIDFLILSHAHIDHIGLLPKLCKEGFKGDVFCSQVTAELAGVLLPDSGHIQEMEIERKNRKLKRADKKQIKPIYTVEDAFNCLSQLRPLNMDETINIAPGIDIRLRDAGHILGACIIELWLEENDHRIKLVFSGDLGNQNQPIVKDPAYIESADYVILESTYGNRQHPSAESRASQLKEVIDRTMARGGNLIIPSFAVERTQDLLYDLFHLHKEGQLSPNIDVYLDSPLAIAATEIFQKNVEFYDNEARQHFDNNSGQHPLKFDNLKFSHTREDSIMLNGRQGNTIIISASGMCEAGRIKHHLKNNLWKPENTVLFVGYQAEGTLGRRILGGEETVIIHGEKVAVKAEIARIEAYSAHADQDGLISWINNFVVPPRGIFLVHGEEESQTALAECLRDKMGVAVYIPEWLDEFKLDPDEKLEPVAEERDDRVVAAARAEQMYLKLCLKLHDMYKDNWKDAKYDIISQKVQKIEELLKD